MTRLAFAPLALLLAATTPALAQQHQTTTVSPTGDGSALPYALQVETIDLNGAVLPTLHSYARAEHDGLWVMLAGRTNGLHGFEGLGDVNFPEASQNRDVWVVDPATGQTWSRSLESASAGLTADQVASLTPTNNQFAQVGDRLYMTGGYGLRADGQFDTFNTLSAIDLPGIIDWVQNATGTAADHIRQTSDESFRVTGGAMHDINGTMHLVFGQSFRGPYLPNRNGEYTNQVRHFTITDDGTTLGFTNASASTPDADFRRRDLNVYTTLRPDGSGGHERGMVALSGVFTEGFGAWTVPVVMDENGNPTMDDPTDPGTFRQGFNGYHSAKIGLYSQTTGEMHEILFGGISLQTLDDNGDTLTDDFLPFVNDITSVVIDADGNFSQHHLGFFPEITDDEGNVMRFGANAEFFVADGIAMLEHDIIDLDALTGDTVIGYIVGGLFSNAPHTRGVDGAVSGGNNQVFAVTYTAIPEPGSLALLALGGLSMMRRRRR
ncbi:MAG: PEP-CTERM sorting domain-containing protein [Planctomycetota bacterium]